MADSLSRSEVESLLSALDPKQPAGSVELQEARSDSFSHGHSPRKSSSLARSAVLFCESIRKQIAVSWETLLREPVRLKRHMPRTLAFSELLDQFQSESLGFLLESSEERADLILLIERQLVEPIIIRLLGNSRLNQTSHELSELEQRLLKRLIGECFRDPLPDCRWSLTTLDRLDVTAERSARPGRTSWWCESWELKTDSLRGKILFAGEWDFVSSSDSQLEIETVVNAAETELVAELDSISLTEEMIRSLQPGDTLPVGENGGETVQIQVGEESSWFGRPGILEGQKAVKIERSDSTND